MMLVKYRLDSAGKTPKGTILSSVPGLNKSQLDLGNFPRKESGVLWMMGFINTDIQSEKDAILSACSTPFGMEEFASEQDACDYVDVLSGMGAGAIKQNKETWDAASISPDGKVQKTFTEVVE